MSPASQPSIPRCPNKWFIVDAVLHALFSFKFRNQQSEIPASAGAASRRQAHSAIEWANFFMDDTEVFE